MQYTYTKEVDIERLTQEILAEDGITAALAYINVTGTDNVDIFFKTSLTSLEKVALDNVVADTVNQPLHNEAPVSVRLSANTDTDGIPYVYTTTRPLNHITYFTGSGDDMVLLKKGAGTKLIFKMLPSDATKYVDVAFYEDIYIKDGLILAESAPFGAVVDVDIVHPLYGPIETFGKSCPIIGGGWFPMNTDDRAHIPKGLKIRVTVKNSRGAAFGEDEPSEFKVLGRLEMFRPKH
jgi:hypothetical protein